MDARTTTAIHTPKTDWIETQLAAIRRNADGIVAALAHAPGDTHSLDDVTAGVLLGRYKLWENERAFALTEIHHFPRESHCHVFLAGGTIDGILDLYEQAKDDSKREHGCVLMTISGRKGWERALAPHGWRHAMTTLYKEFD